MFKVNHDKVQEILKAYNEGREHALTNGERYNHPFAWNVRPSYHREITKAWKNGYDSVKPKR